MSDPIASAADRFVASAQSTGARTQPIYRTAARLSRVVNIGDVRSLVIHPASATRSFTGTTS